MKILIKKIVFTSLFFFTFFDNVTAFDLLIPPKKPFLTKEATERKLSVNTVLPKKKPSLQKKVEKVEKEEIIKKKIVKERERVDDVLLPKAKPLVVKKEERKIKKLKHFTNKEIKLALEAIKLIEKRKWNDAEKTARKSKNRIIYDFVNWRHLLTTGNQVNFAVYKSFIDRNPDYPRIGRIKYLAEHKLSTKEHSANQIINWFNDHPVLSGYGRMLLGESLISIGDKANGIKNIKNGWITADLTKSELRFFRKKYKKYLSNEDHIKRADYLAWENKYWDLHRMLRYLPKDHQLLYTARQLLMSKSYGVDNAISKVPEKMKNDPGLNYDRLKWRRKRGRVDSSLEILLNIKNTKEYMVRPDKWWIERSIISRSLIYKKQFTKAYKISSNHGMTEGSEFAEAEWMSGWIAFTFLNDPVRAKDHFINFYENVGYPISLSRGAYWLGRVYGKLGENDQSISWYKESAKYLTTYYGQLSHMKVYPNQKFTLDELMEVDKKYAESFYEDDVVKLVYLLDAVDKDKYTKHILRYLANKNISKGSEVLAAKLATEISRFDFSIQVSKIASYEKRFHNKYNYPVISTPTYINKRKIPETALILSIIRQESEFDLSAHSHAGAKGLMQLMPYTAKVVAKQAKLPYSKSRLTKDPEYNINLGSYYIAGLILEYEGSYPFAIAAYNAGPKRVRYWKKINKNPQKGKINYVDWIELIKFKETRNYVQRVLENYNVYRYVLEQNPIKLKDFFKNDPLY